MDGNRRQENGKKFAPTQSQIHSSTVQHRQTPLPQRTSSNPQHRQPARKKKKRTQPVQVQRPLSPEAERLRQKRLRAKMRKRRRRRRLLMLITTFALIAACIVVCCKLLFQVNGVRIEIGEQKFHYVLPSAQSSDQQEQSEQLSDQSEPSSETSSSSTEQSAQPSDQGEPSSEVSSSSTEQPETAEQQPTSSPQPTEKPEIMHQGAKEVEAEQPIDQTSYTVGGVVELLQVQAGENLLEMDLQQMVQTVEKQCPYLENVNIYYKLPNTLAVSAAIAVPTFCVQLDGEWAILSANKKVIELSSTQPESLMVLTPGKVTAELGTQILFAADPQPVDEAAILGQQNLTEEERMLQLQQEQEAAQEAAQQDAIARANHLDEMLSLLEKWGIRQDVTQVDVSDSMELQFWYQGRILVKLGTENEMSYKIQFATRILTQELSISDQGQLDASAIQENGELRPVFSRTIQ